MTFSITQASPSDSKDIHKIMSSCTKWLSDKGMDHWIGVYSFEKIKERINWKIVYFIRENEKTVGTITLIKEKPSHFKCWKDLNAEGICIMGLAVDPKHMKKGYATKLIEYAENKAKQENIKYIRFDAISEYENLIKFYINRGYKIVGTKQITNTYKGHFFEKCL